MASGIYSRFKANLMNKVVDLEADTIKVALYDNSHAFNATHTDYTTDNELATTGGYTQGGATLSSPVVTEAATTKWDDDGSNTAWTSATFSAYHAVIYGSGGTNDLIASIDFGGEKAVVAGTFTIQWDAAGIITLT